MNILMRKCWVIPRFRLLKPYNMEPKGIPVNLRLSRGWSYYPNEAKYFKRWLEHEFKLIINFRFLRISSLISKEQKENIICTMYDVRGDLFGQPHGTTYSFIRYLSSSASVV